jgi:hypothetical protein
MRYWCLGRASELIVRPQKVEAVKWATNADRGTVSVLGTRSKAPRLPYHQYVPERNMTRFALSARRAVLAFALGPVLGCGASPPTEGGPGPKSADRSDPLAKGDRPAKTPEAEKKAPPDTVSELEELNVGVPTSPPGWEMDDLARIKVGAPYIVAYRRPKPQAYAAFGASAPWRGRAPLPNEMRAVLCQPLSKLFDVAALREEPLETKWLGEAIAANHGMRFRARAADGQGWVGEAYAVAHKGIAYYWLSWCPESDFDELKDEFASFRGKFKLLGLRDDWKETRSNAIDFKGVRRRTRSPRARSCGRKFRSRRTRNSTRTSTCCCGPLSPRSGAGRRRRTRPNCACM